MSVFYRQSLPRASPLGLRQRLFNRFWKFSFKKFFAECPWPSTRQRQSLPSAKWALGKFSIFFCFFDPKFFVGPAYIVYNIMFKFGVFSSFFVIFGWLIWLCWIFIYNSNLNCKCMEYCNLVLRKILFMVFGVCWVPIHELAPNFGHLLHVTWWGTCRKMFLNYIKSIRSPKITKLVEALCYRMWRLW